MRGRVLISLSREQANELFHAAVVLGDVAAEDGRREARLLEAARVALTRAMSDPCGIAPALVDAASATISRSPRKQVYEMADDLAKAALLAARDFLYEYIDEVER